MATYQDLVSQLDNFPELVVCKHYEADTFRVREYQAALRIQGWLRGHRVRRRIACLAFHATVIQKHWRGYLGRRAYRRVLQETVLQSQAGYYRRMATLIQKTWRGFRSRLHVFNFAEWKGYLDFVSVQNTDLKSTYSVQSRSLEDERRTVGCSEMQLAAMKNHHMVSTKQIPGVYNSPYNRDNVDLERTLASCRFPIPPMRLQRQKLGYNRLEKRAGSDAAVNVKTVQGPFLPPLELQRRQQSTRCRSIRNSVPYNTAELANRELRNHSRMRRVADQPFVASGARVFPPLVTSVQLGTPYQRQPIRFRQPDPARFLTKDGFRRVIKPIATFDGCI